MVEGTSDAPPGCPRLGLLDDRKTGANRHGRRANSTVEEAATAAAAAALGMPRPAAGWVPRGGERGEKGSDNTVSNVARV